MDINKSLIDGIWDDLISQPIISVKTLDTGNIENDPGLYLIYCEKIYSHNYLKFGKSEGLRTRIKKHIKGNKGQSVYNKKLSRDQKLMIEVWDLVEADDRKRFTAEYCSFQYLELNSSIVKICEEIFQDDKLCKKWHDYWKEIYPKIHKARDYLKPYDKNNTIDHKTRLVELPIQENIEEKIRYVGNQPKNWRWNNYSL